MAVHDSIGDAGEFHSSDPPPVRAATFHTVATPTLVLGSAQRVSDINDRVAGALGIAVVKRRSGGGAVLLVPSEFVWLDLVVPVGDALWADDIGQAMVWVGDLWRRALGDLGLSGVVTDVSGGGDVRWARQVCFAGTGRGEVVVVAGKVNGNAGGNDERKVVGVSQRRTRSTARFQSLCHLRWRPELVAALVGSPRPLASELASRVATVTAPRRDIREALVRHLPAL